MCPLDGTDPPPLAPREAPPGSDVARGDDVWGDEEEPLEWPESPDPPDREPEPVSTER
jgi:hypothetical protein